MKKKAQLWHLDLIIGIIIFTAALTIFYSSLANLNRETEFLLDDMNREGSFIADALMSRGFPTNWSEEDVVLLGISEDNRFSQDKINRLYAIEYNKTKSLLRTKYDFYIFFENLSSASVPMIVGEEGIGYPGVDTTTVSQLDTTALIKVIRFGIYNSKPVRMVLYIWA